MKSLCQRRQTFPWVKTHVISAIFFVLSLRIIVLPNLKHCILPTLSRKPLAVGADVEDLPVKSWHCR